MFNNTIKGAFYDPEFWYTKVALRKCDGTQNITCADKREIDDFFEKNDLISVVYQDSFVNLSAHADEFETYLEDRMHYRAKKGLTIKTDYFL